MCAGEFLALTVLTGYLQWFNERARVGQVSWEKAFFFFFFLKGYAIQGKFTTWLVNSMLNFIWKTDIALIASRFVRYIGFSREI